MSEAATCDGKDLTNNKAIVVCDVTGVVFGTRSNRPLCVELPDGDKTAEGYENDMEASVQNSSYGTRGVAASFQQLSSRCYEIG